MPSGSKKRKAAKKKKEKETNTNPSSNNSQGDNELKSQYDKRSDGGEDGTPAHHDHDHPFNEGNEEVEESDSSAALSSAAVTKSMEETPGDIKIAEAKGDRDDESKSEDSYESKNVSVVHIESGKESDYGNQNSGAITMKTEDEPEYSVKETAEFDEFVKSSDSSQCKMGSITQNATVEETVNSVAESSTDSVKAVASVSEVKSRDTGNVLLEKSMDYQEGGTDLGVKKNEDKVYPIIDEDVRTSSLEEPKPKEFGNKVVESVSRSPIPKSSNGAELDKGSATAEASENQPLVASAPHMVQKTSWLSCCGLFEVISGSNR